jgi:hypothetical protein
LLMIGEAFRERLSASAVKPKVVLKGMLAA